MIALFLCKYSILKCPYNISPCVSQLVHYFRIHVPGLLRQVKMDMIRPMLSKWICFGPMLIK